jgi:hypothetical protein
MAASDAAPDGGAFADGAVSDAVTIPRYPGDVRSGRAYRVVMEPTCEHVDAVTDAAPAPRTPDGCEECLAIGSRWVHLRLCLECAHVGCCDSSPNRHATAHNHATGHPLIRSYEPGENWWWCYVDEVAFELDGAPPAPSHR